MPHQSQQTYVIRITFISSLLKTKTFLCVLILQKKKKI